MSLILSQETLTQVTQDIMQSAGSMTAPLFTGTKILAVSFILVNWGKRLIEGMDKAKEEGKSFSIKPTDILYGILYIVLILNINLVTDTLDNLLSSYASSFEVENSQRMYNPLEELLLVDGTEGMAQDTWMDAGVAMMSRFAETLTNVIDPFFWILSILKVLAWLINVIVYPIFMLERAFILMILKVVLPLVLALAALEEFRGMLMKWIRMYMAVFMTGLFFLFVTWFCDSVYYGLAEKFNQYAGIGGTGVPDGDNIGRIILFSVVVFTKAKLYSHSITLSNRIFEK